MEYPKSGFFGIHISHLYHCVKEALQTGSKILTGVILLHLCREKPQSYLQQCTLGPGLPLCGFSRTPVKYYILCCCLLMWERLLPGWDQPTSPEGLRTGQVSLFKRSATSVQAWKAKPVVAQFRTQSLRTAMENYL